MEMQNEYEKTMAFVYLKKSGRETGKGSVVSSVWPTQPGVYGESWRSEAAYEVCPRDTFTFLSAILE